MRPDEQWGTTQAPSATPNGGQLSIERDEKTGDIEMNITATRQNTDPNAWQQAPMYLAPQVYPNTGSAGGGQSGYPGYQPGYPGYQPGYPPNRPGFRPPYQPGYPGFPDRYPSGQTGWPGAPSRPWPPTSGQYPGQRPVYPGYPGYPGQTPVNPSTPGTIPSIPLMPSYPSNPGQNTGYPNPNPGGLYPPPTDGWHWYPGYQGDPGPYPPGVMPLNEGMRSAPRYGGMMPRNGVVPQGRMPYRRR